MTGVQEHTLQLTWRSCAGFERVKGLLAIAHAHTGIALLKMGSSAIEPNEFRN